MILGVLGVTEMLWGCLVVSRDPGEVWSAPLILCVAQGQGGVHFAQTCFPRQELRKFMREVKRGNPTAAITLQVSYISF